MTRQVLGWIVLGGVLLVCLGLLLGAAWTIQALQPKFDQQAEERRRLNEEWAAVHAVHRQLEKCPHCAYPLTKRGWYLAQTPPEDPPDDG
ncbi:MAG: hypothetical protein M3460_12220 [Actinomycetota bacterium]|nr:hypothetical protein [Actinomycetota bacterium]